jgi:hypothetical protein
MVSNIKNGDSGAIGFANVCDPNDGKNQVLFHMSSQVAFHVLGYKAKASIAAIQ